MHKRSDLTLNLLIFLIDLSTFHIWNFPLPISNIEISKQKTNYTGPSQAVRRYMLMAKIMDLTHYSIGAVPLDACRNFIFYLLSYINLCEKMN
jgi:hypothetical protein